MEYQLREGLVKKHKDLLSYLKAKGNEEFFKKVEKALREVHGFSKANLSVVFYGFCSKCERRDHLTDL